ncbi:MAG: N-acetylneuraminate synthase [Nitrospirae bacterium]|nr:N-acetylneuraminate synthase [Nitrospirota bacterium]
MFELLADHVMVIAEIGCNHNGSMELAKELIEIVADSGADVAKFQTFNPDEMITINAPKAVYQVKATGMKESQYDRLKRMMFSRQQFGELKVLCEKRNIMFSSSPFDFQSADMLNEMDIPFFKIPSGEITTLPLLSYIGSFRKPIIMSTGMANLGEIEEALDAIGSSNRKNIALMHCTSDYPAKWEEVNLLAIKTLWEAFKLPVGFSDHSEGIELSLVAVGLGARIIERHITLDRNMEGGDHKASLEPDDFKDLVAKIRRLELALGDGIKRCMPSEINVREVARKSIVARKNIKKGDLITKDAIAIKRPGTGIAPKYLEFILGGYANEDISLDELMRWSQINFGDKQNK